MEWVIGRRVWLLQIEWISRVNEKASFGKNRESRESAMRMTRAYSGRENSQWNSLKAGAGLQGLKKKEANMVGEE